MKLFVLDLLVVFFFNDTATTEIYTLSLHDALPIFRKWRRRGRGWASHTWLLGSAPRSEEHTSELQSPCKLVCRLLLEKKKKYMLCHLRYQQQQHSAQANSNGEST